MKAFLEMTGNVALFMLLMLPGWILGKMRRISESEIDALGTLLTCVAMPALVLCKLLEADFSSLHPTAVLISMLLPVLVVLLTDGVTVLLLGKKRAREMGVRRFCAVFSNCGFLGIPLASALFPNAPEIAVYVSLFNVVNTFLLLTVGNSILSPGAQRPNWKRLLCTPVVLCILLGAVLLWIGHAPLCGVVATYTSYFAMLTAPLSMLVLGYELSKVKVGQMLRSRALYSVSLIKLVWMPLLALGVLLLLNFLPAVTVEKRLATAMLLATGVSTAASAPAMAGANGADRSHATTLTLGTTLLCLVTLPLLNLLFELLF